jgi:O-antigen/teichoic acid export membrane protein
VVSDPRSDQDAAAGAEPTDPSTPVARAVADADRGPVAESDPALQRRRRGLNLFRKAGWTLIDQVLSALTNMVLNVLVVKAAGARAFDAFAVAFLLFTTLIGVVRAMVGQPVAIRHSADAPDRQPRTVARATGMSLAITLPAAVLMLAVGVVLQGRLGTALIALAVVLPFLILQDVIRFAFFSHSAAHLAALNDGLWAVVQFGAMALIIAFGVANATTLILAWGGAAAVCVLVGLVQLKAVPDLRAAKGWLVEHRDLVGYMVGEYALTTGAFNGGYLTIGAIVGDQAVGSIRAAQVLVGPLPIVVSAAMSFGLPELSKRVWSLALRTRWRIGVISTVGMAVVSLVYTGLLMAMPDSIGSLIFSGKWFEAKEVLLPMSLATAAAASAFGPSLVIYAMGQARRAFRVLSVEAPLVFALLLGGSFLDGVRGAAWGQLIDGAVIIWLWVWTLRQVLKEDPPPPDAFDDRLGTIGPEPIRTPPEGVAVRPV